MSSSERVPTEEEIATSQERIYDAMQSRDYKDFVKYLKINCDYDDMTEPEDYYEYILDNEMTNYLTIFLELSGVFEEAIGYAIEKDYLEAIEVIVSLAKTRGAEEDIIDVLEDSKYKYLIEKYEL